MSQTILEIAKELVAEQIRMHQLPPDDAIALLRSTHATLVGLYQNEAPRVTSASPSTPAEALSKDWKRSISKHAIKHRVAGQDCSRQAP